MTYLIRPKRPLLFILACFIACMSIPQAIGATPVETFAKLPAYDSISLRADGNQAVALQAAGGTYHVVLLDFKAGEVKLLMAADPENFLFNWCRFANKTRIVCSIRSYIVLKAGAIGAGTRYYQEGRAVVTRLLAIDADGKNQIQLVPEPKSRLGGKLVWNPPYQDDVVSWLPRDREHILIQLAREDRIHPSLYKLNIYTNKLSKQQTFISSIARWHTDDNGQVRFAVGREASGKDVAHSFATGKRVKIDLDHLDAAWTLGMADDDKSLYAVANYNGANTQGLHRIDLTTGAVLETMLEHPKYDVTRARQHRATRAILYAGYIEEGEHFTWFNKDLEQAINSVRTNLGNPSLIDIWSATRSLGHLVLHVQGNGVEPSLYRFDVAAKSLLKLSTTPLVKAVAFDYVQYPARDGQIIPAYLALPGPREAGPYPTIIDPHGGPWSEDEGRIDFLTQFFVDRGYAVLKPNFRGSVGYGDRYLEAGFGEWGGLMQNDVIDGLDWMVQQSLADADRTCIHGASYGGYVALVAAYKTPEKFKCAISFAGVTDLTGLKAQMFKFRFGRLGTARLPKGQALQRNSPIENVDKIGTPLLIVHGDVDRSVMIEQSRDLVSALKKANKEHTYIEQTNGDHFFSLEAHRLQYLQAVDAFLAKHIKQ